MQIIKKGRPQRGWSKNFKCTGAGNDGGGCGAVLLVSEYDIYPMYIGNGEGGSECLYTFCCQECGVETEITEGKRPPEAKGKRPSEKARREMALKNKK
ncbi:MAG: hypothetical protein Q8R36_01680 [bacterium]|nr:hypothetical protein [bacterium]